MKKRNNKISFSHSINHSWYSHLVSPTGIIITIIFLALLLSYVSFLYKAPTYIYPVPLTLLPSNTPTPSPTVTPTPYIPFSVSQCPIEGSQETVNQAFAIRMQAFGQRQPTPTINPVSLWEPDAFVISTISVHDLIQSTNPYVTIYASVCTKKYLLVWSMGGGIGASVINSLTNPLPWGIMIDFTQLAKSEPFAAQKTFANLDPYDPLLYTLSFSPLIIPSPSKFGKNSVENGHVIVTTEHKTFPATYYQIQKDYLKGHGLTYTYLFMNAGTLSAKILTDKYGHVLSFAIW